MLFNVAIDVIPRTITFEYVDGLIFARRSISDFVKPSRFRSRSIFSTCNLSMAKDIIKLLKQCQEKRSRIIRVEIVSK